jgi:hypothetical protein
LTVPQLTRRSLVGAGIASLAGALSNRSSAEELSGAASNRPSLIIAPDREFAAGSYVHRPLPADLPLDPLSRAWVASINDQIRRHFSRAAMNTNRFSPPIFIVGADEPTMRIRARRRQEPSWAFPPLEALWTDVPLPADFQPAQGTDREAILYQPETGRYWEFWMLERTGETTRNSQGAEVAEWAAAWGGHIGDLSRNPGYFETAGDGVTYGTAATGLVLLAGLVTMAEQRRGEVRHALHLGLPETRKGSWIWPAQRSDGRVADEKAILQGAIFRLPAEIDLESQVMTGYARMLARAVQRYGMVVRDTAGAVTLYAENPMLEGSANPYFQPDGLFGCPRKKTLQQCWSMDPLEGFPWDKLVAIARR